MRLFKSTFLTDYVRLQLGRALANDVTTRVDQRVKPRVLKLYFYTNTAFCSNFKHMAGDHVGE